jgi:hypothetical protein
MSVVIYRSEVSIPIQVNPRIGIHAVYELTASLEHENGLPTVVFVITGKRKDRAREDVARAIANVRSLFRFTKQTFFIKAVTMDDLRNVCKQFGVNIKNVSSKEELKSRLSSHIGTECTICRDEFHPEEWLLKTHCNHYFHQNCLEKWVETQLGENHSVEMGTCPLCVAALDVRPQTKQIELRRSARMRNLTCNRFHPYSS